MSRIGDYVIGEQEGGRMSLPPDDPREAAIQLEDDVPIPEQLTDRSDLNTRFGDLQSTFVKMNQGQSFVLSGMSDKEIVALRARVSRANKKLDGRFGLHMEGRDDNGINARIYRVE